jgi:hypothetical protein
VFGFLFRLLRRRLLVAALPAALSLAGAAFAWLRNRRKPSADGADSVGPAHGATAD